MDDLSPSCVTSRNGRIYAFGLTHVLSRGSVTSSAYFLIQSNPNPSQALDDLSWTLISSVDTSGYSDIKTSDTYGPFSASQFSCIMDDKGVFSILNIDGANIKAGLQYQPPSLGTSGTGVWKNITIPANYQWDRYDYAELFNYQDNQGKDTLMHVTQGELFNVYVASLDSSTMTMNQGIAPWNNWQ
ncbi:hypothetical protein BGX31_007135 [Mortierella sp. GBA43]|nr:hypothetical protein BGX31_007135 [Mortierella sp. GBA43]